jgi:chromatin remodeling complex protein RSC6|tara:strand:+ start:6823 stop:7233 length:411 start_codon:yes stop_codon:yes gene_type:complete
MSAQTIANDPPSFADAEEKIATLKTTLSELVTILKAIEKSSPKKRPKVKKVEKPRKIKSELAKFMKLSQPVSSREGVLRYISQYVREKKLQDPKNKREFVVDKTLSTLLKLKPGTKLTFLGINKYISHLFVDSPKK